MQELLSCEILAIPAAVAADIRTVLPNICMYTVDRHHCSNLWWAGTYTPSDAMQWLVTVLFENGFCIIFSFFFLLFSMYSVVPFAYIVVFFKPRLYQVF
jgi:hypothetical protein